MRFRKEGKWQSKSAANTGDDELLIPEALPETWDDISVRSVFSADAAKAFPE